MSLDQSTGTFPDHAGAANIIASDTPDFSAIKSKQQAAWSSGDYSVVGVTLQIVGERLCETLDLRPGQTVLDVAAGNGNASLAAARRWCDVVSTDYVEAWLQRGRQRAEASGLEIDFRTADAENLPFEDETFDAVMSTFGVMFTPDQQRAATEMLRVCRPGGKIGMANWTPDSFIGQLFKTIGRHLPPPVGLKSPALWGTRDHLISLFGDHAGTIDVSEQTFVFRYKSAEHWLSLWRMVYGPMEKAFGALEPQAREELAEDMRALVEDFNVATDGTMIVPAQYLEVAVTRT